MPILELDESTHTYTLDGQKLDGVTSVLGAVLRTSSPWWKPEHRLRGTFVHRICEAINDKEWDADAVVVPTGWTEKDRQELVARGLGYQQFISGSGFVPAGSEVRVYSKHLKIAGTADVIGAITKGTYAGLPAIIDVKSGAPTAAAKLQVALYNLCLREAGFRASVHIILHLKASGVATPYYRVGADVERDITDALSVVNVFRFMQREGLTA